MQSSYVLLNFLLAAESLWNFFISEDRAWNFSSNDTKMAKLWENGPKAILHYAIEIRKRINLAFWY